MNGYKVVRVVDSKYYSCTLNFAIEYKVGIWTKPSKGEGPLACFKDLKKAKFFMAGIPANLKLFKIKYKKSIFKKEFHSSYNYNLWYKLKQNKLTTLNGAIYARKIKLLKEI